MTAVHTPVIVGVSQFTQAKDTPSPADPLGLMTITAKNAAKDSGMEKLLEHVDTIRVVNIFSHAYKDVCGELAKNLNISPKYKYYSPVGGNTPQLYINKAANDITAGKSRVTVITGAEAGFAARRAQKGEITLNWPAYEAPQYLDGEEREGGSDHEFFYDIMAPPYAYAYIENALRHASGRDIETHRKIIGDICSRLSKVASRNPYAWFRTERTADEISKPVAPNRFVGFPYTLWMSANLNVDQSAAVLMTSEAFAEELGIPSEKWVYPMGGASFNNIWNLSRRPELFTSPALENAGKLALEQAGLSINDIDVFDFYNCFPCAVEIAKNALGVSIDDKREISLTGGLAYFGGPGNNYSLHSISNVVNYIRATLGKKALVTALGWFNTKWSVGVYGKEKGAFPWHDRDDSAIQEQIEQAALPDPIEQAEGILEIESYIIVYEKSGLPHHMTVTGRLENGRRAFAFMFGPPEVLSRFETHCPIGKKGKVTYEPEGGRNLISLENESG
ncbi:MAG: acetyl-CoA acetyltransferase [Proteobacteria bacterium]|nr:acetyl-CoA acetyltransferase [Pseudomonadota bacterium]